MNKFQDLKNSPLGNSGKTLFIVRHAKSSWEDVNLADFDRPLNDRGKKDAPEMGKRLVNKKINIEAFISSPAKRAKKTAELFIKEFDRNKEEIIFVPALYHASINEIYETVYTIGNQFKSAALFSHNPGITAFANDLTHKAQLDNMPTCSVFAVVADIKEWSDFKNAIKEFWFFDYPKKDY